MEVTAARVPPGDVSGAPWLGCPPGFPQRSWALVTSFLPDAVDTCLLRAALLSGDAAREAWSRWRSTVGDPVHALGTDKRNIKALVPLLARNLRAHGVEAGTSFGTYGTAAHLTETLRMSRYLRECGAALELLSSVDVPHLVLKGAALAETVYRDPALRHAHDFDVLVPEEALNRATEVLRAHGFAPYGFVGLGVHHLTPLRNDAGLVVELHRRLCHVHAGFEVEAVWRRSVPARVGGRDTRVLSRADALVHAGEHAVSCRSSANLRWVCDAWWLAQELSETDWSSVVEIAITSRVALPIAITLGYLEDALGPVVPASVLARLKAEAARTDKVGMSAAVFGARLSLPQDLAGILRMRDGWRRRVGQLGWRLLPPPRHVRWWFGIRRDWLVPLYYPYRFWLLATDLARRPTRPS